MTLGKLNKLLAAEPALARYKVRVLLKRDQDDLARVAVDRVEFDERDADLNLVVGQSSAAATIPDLAALLSTSRAYPDSTPLFVRHYVDPSLHAPDFRSVIETRRFIHTPRNQKRRRLDYWSGSRAWRIYSMIRPNQSLERTADRHENSKQ